MRIQALPEAERPRERLLRVGPDALSDTELLAVVLGTGASGTSALTAAASLLARFRELVRMANGGVEELATVKGVGLVGACRVKAALGLAGRLGKPFLRGEPLGTPREVYERLGPELSNHENERFVAVALDRRNRVLRTLTVAQGGVCSVEIIPRDVFAAIVREAAVSVVFLHNHPSGDPTPSPDDKALTQRLRQAGRVVGVPVTDHIIVGKEGYYSFFEDEQARGGR